MKLQSASWVFQLLVFCLMGPLLPSLQAFSQELGLDSVADVPKSPETNPDANPVTTPSPRPNIETNAIANDPSAAQPQVNAAKKAPPTSPPRRRLPPIAKAQKSLRPIKYPLPTPDYNIPLHFDVVGDGVTLKPLRLAWDLSSQNQLLINDVQFDDRNFSVGIFQLESLDKNLKDIFNMTEGKEWIFLAKWPRGLLQSSGAIEAFNRSGQVLWRQEIKTSDFDDWQNQLNSWRQSLRTLSSSKLSRTAKNSLPIFQINYGLRHFKEEPQPFWTVQEPFRICISNDLENGLITRMCSQLLEVKHIGKQGLALLPVVRVAEQARVIAFNDSAPLKDDREVEFGKPVQFYAELANGASFEFIAKPEPFNLVEMTQTQTGQVRVMAWGQEPNLPVHRIKNENIGLIERIIGSAWSHTIGETRNFWEVTIPPENPHLDVPGEGGGLFRLPFEITKLPTEKVRPYLSKHSLDATYIDGSKFFVRAPPKVKASSKQNRAKIDDNRINVYKWEFGAKKRGELNKSIFNLDDGQQKFRAYTEIYKGYPGEVSARLTGIYGSGGNLIALGDVAAGYWFESVAGWSNYYLSRDRWGVSAKYFQTLTPITVAGTAAQTTGNVTINAAPSFSATMANTEAELRYRFAPGLWSRDETWGIEGSSNYLSMTGSTSYGGINVQFLGGGIFWARSMPKIFDELFNLVPYMRYPKWVDLEFIYYPLVAGGITPNITTNNIGTGYGNWQMNFHGKVMWMKNIFGEAGFGMRQYDFNANIVTPFTKSFVFRFTSFYGTMGLGISF